jgi:glycosyltransferase involved in cell wall biosynthesis
VGEVKRVFEEHGVGVLCAPDPEAMAAEVVALLRDPEAAREMGARARLAAQEHYTWEHLVENLEQFYMAILDGAPVPEARPAAPSAS